MKIAYISGRFPSTSLVFEQNECLGLIRSGADLSLWSCRHVPADEEPHSFARPLLHTVRYQRWGSTAKGGVWACLMSPKGLLSAGVRAFGGALADPRRARQHLGALAIALSAAPEEHARGCEWVHADFVQGTATTAWHLAALLNVPFSATAHAFDIYSDEKGLRERDGFFRRKMGHASFIHVVSEYGRARLLTLLPSSAASKTHLHRVTVRVEEFELQVWPDMNSPLFVGLGRLVEKKGFQHLVRAVAILRDRRQPCAVELWGDGDFEEDLKALVSELGLDDRVRIKGRYTQEQLPNILRRSRALVVPSVVDRHGDMDGIPTVIYEAMAHGRPVVGTRLSGIPEVIEADKTGWICEPEDDEGLASILSVLIDGVESCREMGLAARAYVEQNHDHVKRAAVLLDRIRVTKDGR